MKSFVVSKLFSPALAGIFPLVAAGLAPIRVSALPLEAWERAALDQLLAAAPPDQPLIQIGDMRILASRLRLQRDRASGDFTLQSAFDGVAPLWSGGNVYYSFDASVSAAKRKAFLDGAAEWAMFANLRFIARTSQANYVTIRQVPGLGGGQSAVGMVGGQQFLDLDPGAWSRAIICHEIGHLLGLVHEHQRSDRDAFVTIVTENLIPGTEANFVRLGNTVNQSPYDFLSVMHYRHDAYSVEPGVLETIEPRPAYASFLEQMGQQFDPALSPSDRAGMAAKYGPGPALGSVVTNTLDSGPGSLRAALYFAQDHPGTTITFNPPTTDPGFSNGVYTIQPTDRLPGLRNATVLDGRSIPNNSNFAGPEIALNGALCDPQSVAADGLRLLGTNCVVQNLVINGFPGAGIVIDGTNARGNIVRGCYVGINATGTAAVTNRDVPLIISGGASGNLVGGNEAAARNIFSGSALDGVIVRSVGTRSNTIAGNYIGLNATGTAALRNANAGLLIYNGAQDNLIGGTNVGAGNVISGNGYEGLGIAGTNTTGNRVEGNLLGLNAAGSAAIPNAWSGASLFGGARSNLIGGANPAARNVISGNSLQGLTVAEAGTSGNVVAGNFIGLNLTGTAAIPNGWAGIQLYGGAQANTIGGALGSPNVVSGNSLQGILLSGAETLGNVVAGNYIGLNPAGTAALPNGWSGVEISSSSHANTIGGSTPSTRNVVSGNLQYGIMISGSQCSANIVSGNYVGLNAAGTGTVPNQWSGVAVFGGAHDNLIGGADAAAGNVISGNANYGINLSGTNTSRNRVQGNRIGLNAGGTAPIGNGWDGISIYGGATANTVGLNIDDTGAPNQIAHNSGGGIAVFDPGTIRNTLRGNQLFANAYLGINLFGGAESFFGNTFNDSDDADSGPNELQNYPVLTEATARGSRTTVVGALNGAVHQTFIIDFYANETTDASGYGEAQQYLGSTTATTDGTGTTSFALELNGNTSGKYLTATATDRTSGNTSEFCTGLMTVTGPAQPEFVSPPTWTPTGFSVSLALTPGQTYRVQATTNLGAVPVAWSNLTNFTASTTNFSFRDRTATNLPQRFYRIVSP